MKHSKTELAAVIAAARTLSVPLSKLVTETEYQQRKVKHTDAEIDTLAASIRTLGLLQNLVVVKLDEETYAVVAGEGRTRALHKLAEEGLVARDLLVACLEIAPEHAALASLVENHHRVNMHPADLYDSYAVQAAQGKSVEQIAAECGATVPAVRKLLALGQVAPELLDLYRAGEMKLEAVQALTLTTDHEAQRAAWAYASAGSTWAVTDSIREALAKTEFTARSLIARFVTVEAYELAGGRVTRDLFNDAADGVLLHDSALLHQLAMDQIKASDAYRSAEQVGWGWLDCRLEFGGEEKRAFGQITASLQPLTQEQLEQRNALVAQEEEAERLFEEVSEDENADDEAYDTAEQLHDAATEALANFDARHSSISVEDRAHCGVVVHLDYRGKVVAQTGLIRAEDRAYFAEKQRVGAAAGEHSDVQLPKAKTRPVHSDALVQRMRVQRVVAAQAELLSRPELAWALLLAQMTQSVFGRSRGDAALFDIAAHNSEDDLLRVDAGVKGSAAWVVVAQATAQWKEKLPAELDDTTTLAEWLVAQPLSELLSLQALLLSLTVYRARYAQSFAGEQTHIEAFAQQINLDMTKWWKPTQESYLSHVGKDRILAVLEQAEATAPEKASAMRKGDLAAEAETLLAGKGWLPEELRTGLGAK